MLVLATGVALPIVKSLPQAGDYALTVSPFVPQLSDLPSRLLQAGLDWDALKTVYVTTNPLIFGFALSLAISPIFLIVSEINKNYSQVDRFWSLLPTFYIAHYCLWAHLAGINTDRVDIVLALGLLWSTRLTFNYWRRGGYQIGSEDYRWEIIQSKVPGFVFFLFNVTFISTMQNVLLFSVTTPVYVLLLASRVQGDQKTVTDMFFAGLIASLVVVEFIADQQQWNFQESKKEYLKTAKPPNGFTREDLDRGFLVKGLWAWSRHPNFLAEQAIWVSLYEWGSLESNRLYNWTALGALSYLLLFQGSTRFTESITAGKYPAYADYRRKVSMFLPKASTVFADPVDATPPQRRGAKKTS